MLVKKARRMVMSAAVLTAACGLAWSARADLPAALDRVPADAVVAISMKDISKFHGQFMKLTEAAGLPADLGMVDQLLATPGLNKNGSAAMVLMAIEEKDPNAAEGDEDEPGPMVMVVPVSDYAAFVKAFGGSGEDKIASLTLPEEMDMEGSTTAYAKDLGGGYAAMGPMKEVVEAFDGSAGKADAHKKALGPVGNRVADASEGVLVANIEKLAPKMEQGLQQMKDQMGMMMAMAGQQADQMETQIKVAEAVVKALGRDASVGIVGAAFGEKGATFDLAAQFKEGTPSHKLFQSKGTSSKLLSRLPGQPFLFAGAIDVSSPGMKDLFRQAADLSKGQAEAMMPGMTAMFMKTLDSMDGMAVSMGYTPALMAGGMMSNTVALVSTKDPAGYQDMLKQTWEQMNGKSMQGAKITTSFKAAAAEVGGTKADEWSVGFEMDPDAEAGPEMQQIQMMQQMIWGPQGGPSGYMAVVDNAVVQTMGKNKKLLEQSIDAAKGKGSDPDALLKEVSQTLPDGRTFEAYIGTKSVLDTVMGFMAMMGGGGDVKVPPQVSPIGFGGMTDAGGIQIRTHIPADVIKTIGEIGQSMNGGMEEEEMEEEDAPPKF